VSRDALAGRRALVMGLGLFGGGVAAARFLAERGADVTVTDLRDADVLASAVRALDGVPVRFVLGEHHEDDFRTAELLVVNPAVPRHASLVCLARESGARVTSEVGLFLDNVRAPVIGVTGTQGKSSTCRFIADLLEACGRRVRLGGNIGRPLLAEVDEIEPDEFVVLELSSYQLECLPDDVQRERDASALRVGIITNVLADHLERHGTREAYVAAKLRLLELLPPGAMVLLPADADWLPGANALPADVRALSFQADPARSFQAGSAGGPSHAALHLGDTDFRLGEESLAPFDAAPVLPDFQRTNLLAALGAARLIGVEPVELHAALPAVRGLPHRLCDLGERGARRVFDNAVSTTPDSTVSALRALEPGMTVLLGGKLKGLDTRELTRVVLERAARAILFGDAAAAWSANFRAQGIETHTTHTVREALTAAYELSNPGDTLLFSPACPSFDAYPNFQARADDFLAALPPR